MNRPKQFVGLIGIIAAIGGLLITIAPAFVSQSTVRSLTFKIFGALFQQGQLSLFYPDFWEYQHHDMNYGVNYFTLMFFSLMLLGSLLFLARGFKESKLLGFSFSIIFLMNLLHLLYIISILIAYFKEINYRGGSTSLFFLSIGISVAWLVLSYKIIRIINRNNAIEVIDHETDGVITKSYILANRWQRFLHLIVDRILILLIFSPYIYVLGLIFRGSLSLSNDRLVIYGLVSVFVLVYYPLFETLFGITPAKFFTNSAVIREDGSKAGFKTIFLRSLSRLVPFEALSFLGDEGWHDRWTRTWVVRKQNKGIKTRWYLLLIPIAALFAWGGYLLMSGYRDHKEYVENKRSHDEKMKSFNDEYQHLTTGHYIEFRDNSYNVAECFMKVEASDKENITFTKMTFTYSDEVRDVLQAQGWYMMNPDKRDTVVIARSTFQKILEEEYTTGYLDETGVALFADKVKYRIEEIYNLDEPCLKRSEYSGNMSSNRVWNGSGEENDRKNTYHLNIALHNYGAAAQLTELTSMDRKVKWNVEVPQWIDPAYNKPGSLNLSCNDYELEAEYKTKLVLKDNSGKKYTYMIEGSGIDYTIRRIF